MSHQVAEKYKGKWVRLYKSKQSYVEGVLLGSWHHYYVTLQSEEGRSAQVTFIDREDVRLVLPMHLLDENGKIFRYVYANYN